MKYIIPLKVTNKHRLTIESENSNGSCDEGCKGVGLGLGPERAKQARGRARGAGGKEERDEWCRSRGSVDKFEAMIASKCHKS